MTGQLLTDLVHGFTQGPFTARKLVVMLVVVVVAGLGVAAYEIETANFALEKYAKVAGILKDLDAASTSENTNIVSVVEVLTGRVREILAETREDPSLSENEHRVALALALVLGLPWVILSIVGVIEAIRQEPDWQYGLFGCLFLAAVLGGAGYVLPTDVLWFYRYLMIPLIVYSALLGLFYVAGDDEPEPDVVGDLRDGRPRRRRR